MNKIALLTIHHTTNFGSALQTFALYQTIQAFGGNIELLDYRCKAIEDREFIKFDWHHPKSIYRYMIQGRIMKKKERIFDKFISTYAELSKTYTRENVYQANAEYGTFLVGSDIVWGLNVTGNDLTYFLDFVEAEKRKLAFGPSSGLKWSENDERRLLPLLQRFEHIGVRERVVADWINELTGEKPDVVADPTMLWKTEKWEKMAEEPSVKEPYVLVYFWDSKEKILEDAKRLGEKKGMKVYSIRYGSPRRGICSIQPLSVEEFLGLIKNASYILTGSFHGLLFALYFHREVFYYNRANYSRMESLSRWLNIEDHNGMDGQIEYATPLNFEEIDKKICLQRKESLRLLQNYLKIGEERKVDIDRGTNRE